MMRLGKMAVIKVPSPIVNPQGNKRHGAEVGSTGDADKGSPRPSSPTGEDITLKSLQAGKQHRPICIERSPELESWVSPPSGGDYNRNH